MATIKYTLDGSDPSPTHGFVYTGPFSVGVTTLVRAIVYGDDLEPSEITEVLYTIEEEEPEPEEPQEEGDCLESVCLAPTESTPTCVLPLNPVTTCLTTPPAQSVNCLEAAPATTRCGNDRLEDECPEGTTGEVVFILANAFFAANKDAANALAQAALDALRLAQPCVDDEQLAVIASFVSELREGTLIGHSEYTNPSIPPKKYRRQTLTGTSCNNDRVNHPQCADCSGDRNFPDCNDHPISGVPHQADDEAWQGSYVYDQFTGAVTDTQLKSQHVFVALTFCSNIVPEYLHALPTYPVPGTIPSDPAAILFTSQTVKSWTGSGVCFYAGPFFNCPGCPEEDVWRQVFGTLTRTLSEEDTEEDAFVRGTSTAGTSNVAKTKLRGAGDFDATDTIVSLDLDATGLTNGLDYEITVPIVTENYGGGSPVNSNLTYNFTATGPTENINDVIQAAAGQQITIGTPTIALV